MVPEGLLGTEVLIVSEVFTPHNDTRIDPMESAQRLDNLEESLSHAAQYASPHEILRISRVFRE